VAGHRNGMAPPYRPRSARSPASVTRSRVMSISRSPVSMGSEWSITSPAHHAGNDPEREAVRDQQRVGGAVVTRGQEIDTGRKERSIIGSLGIFG
jgi:hypothetical protein